VFGHVPGFPVGSVFEDRTALRASGVHRPPQAGICGTAAGGAESVLLAGGYVDDEDHGGTVLYTGAGGRDARSKRQTADQTLNGPNLALATSQRLGLPVRVVRLVRDRTERYFEYAGLYRVADYFPGIGEDNFQIWRFQLERITKTVYETHAPTGRVGETPALFGKPTGNEEPRRVEATVSRVVRDTGVTREVKRLHGYRCQMCGDRVETPTGPYAEAAHVRPLGRPHDGPDVLANVLCLCPNHHSAFDLYGVGIADDLGLIGLPGRLRTAKGHDVAAVHIRYRRGLLDAAQGEAADAARRAA
jgi:putative restriction endonuclease